MSIRNDGFVTYSELQSYERRARELRSEAIRAGVASLFNIGKRDRTATRTASNQHSMPRTSKRARVTLFFDHGGLTSIDILP